MLGERQLRDRQLGDRQLEDRQLEDRQLGDRQLGKHSRWLLVLATFLALAGLRFIHLEADTPVGVGTWSMGVYVDEGYKTLHPRNLALFGSMKWHSLDNFPGWMDHRLGYKNRFHFSPLTQWYYYFAFRLLGPELGSVRVATILLYSFFLLGYVLAFRRRYSQPVLFLGLLLLGLHGSLFFFSRIALFTTPVILFIYGLLFVLTRLDAAPTHQVVGVIFAFSILVTFGVRIAAPMYILPILIGCITARWIVSEEPTSKKISIALWLMILVALMAYPTRQIWQYAFHLPGMFERIVSPPLLAASSLLIASGLFVAFHVFMTRPEAFLGNMYRASLIALVILGPIIIGVFRQGPLRYYIPLLPAYALLILEWLSARAWLWSIPDRVRGWIHALCVPLLIWMGFSLAQGFNLEILQVMGVSGRSMTSYILPILATVGVLIWLARNRIFKGRRGLVLIATLILLSLVRDTYVVGRFLVAPSYQSREISRALEEILPEDASLIGDWAPFFTLGTNLKTLYRNRIFNGLPKLGENRPEYFLFSETEDNHGEFPRFKNADLGPSLYDSSYIGRRLSLHALRYSPESNP